MILLLPVRFEQMLRYQYFRFYTLPLHSANVVVNMVLLRMDLCDEDVAC